MLNKLLPFMRRFHMTDPGDSVICAVSGGPDSMALLWAMYLLREKLDISIRAAHFNHHLREAESDRDEVFVRQFCESYEIPFLCGSADVVPGEKGLEAAARDARYGFLRSLPGKIATAHNADDNAETLLMHLIRGTGLRGLGAIAPVNGQLIRPMLEITRREILEFLEEYGIPFVQDSTNSGDQFLRNRIRHHVMPLLQQENPSLAVNLSRTALRLRKDEQALAHAAQQYKTTDINVLRIMDSGVRARVLTMLLNSWGVKEPEAEHILLAESIVFSENPSAKADFPGGVTVARVYDHLEKRVPEQSLACRVLPCPGHAEFPELGLRVICSALPNSGTCVQPVGTVVLRSRQPGDTLRLPGGTRSLKKAMIDRRIPAFRRSQIPVLADDKGVLAVYGIGWNLERKTKNGIWIRFEPIAD